METETKNAVKQKDPHAPVKVRVKSAGFKHQETHGAHDVPIGTELHLTPGQASSATKQGFIEVVE
jgi:hypothetical protein